MDTYTEKLPVEAFYDKNFWVYIYFDVSLTFFTAYNRKL